MAQASAPTTARITASVLALAGIGVLLTQGYRLVTGNWEPKILSLGVIFFGVYATYWLGHYALFGCRPGTIRQ